MSEEFRGGERVGIKLEASEAGVTAHWGELVRVLTPTQARLLSDHLRLLAVEAEARGAKDWIG